MICRDKLSLELGLIIPNTNVFIHKKFANSLTNTAPFFVGIFITAYEKSGIFFIGNKHGMVEKNTR